MIRTFNNVDTKFASASDTVSVKSGKSTMSHITLSPGRYSLSRYLEDQNTARTVNPNHGYYQTCEY